MNYPAPSSAAVTSAGLAAIEAASTLKARYFRFMDTKRWDEWEALYLPDAVMDMRGEADAMASLGFAMPDRETLVWRGASLIRQAVSGALADVVTVHHGHMGEFTFLSENRISAIWAMEDVIRYGPHVPIAGFNGYGHYHDVYDLVDGHWRIASVTLSRLAITPFHGR